METSVSDLQTSHSKKLFLVCLQVIFAPCTNRAEMLLFFLLHSQYIEQQAGGCSPPRIINTSCHLTIASVCICVTIESIRWLHYNFPVDSIKYGVTAQSFHFTCWGFAMDVFGISRKKILCSEGPSHCKTYGILAPWAMTASSFTQSLLWPNILSYSLKSLLVSRATHGKN